MSNFINSVNQSKNVFNVEKIMFERQLYNKCSSYIDNNMHYGLVASDLMLTSTNSKKNNRCKDTQREHNLVKTTIKKSTKSKMKRVKQVVSSKLKRILHLNDNNEEEEDEVEEDACDNVKNSDTSRNVRIKINKSYNDIKKRLSSSFNKSRLATLKNTNGSLLEDNVQLVNFKYSTNSINRNEFFISTNLNTRKQRSVGQLSCGSSGSGSSNNDCEDRMEQPDFDDESQQPCVDLFDSELFMSSQLTHLFSINQQQQERAHGKTSWFDCTSKLVAAAATPVASSSVVQTSTPMNRTNRMLPSRFNDRATSTKTPVQHSKFYDVDNFYLVNTNYQDNDETCNYNDVAQMMDESTQAPVDAPVLVESTFNTSSCSNLSDDLIILQTALPVLQQTPRFNSTKKVPSPTRRSARKNNIKFDKKESTKFLNATKDSQKSKWNLSVINKCLESEKVPHWAVGHELNLAIVNQLYFNPNGHGIFNSTTSTLINKKLN